MRTARSSSHPGGGVSTSPSQQQAPPRDQAPPPVDGITDACENIIIILHINILLLTRIAWSNFKWKQNNLEYKILFD